jgi:thiol:disulfide interchange protein DsbA
LDKAKFAEVFNSFGVATKARRATQLQESFKVQGVPSLGIAGRFYTDGSLASSMESALAVTDYLIGQVRKGR